MKKHIALSSFIVISSAIACSAAIAGGPERYSYDYNSAASGSAPTQVAATKQQQFLSNDSGLYVDVDIGLARANWLYYTSNANHKSLKFSNGRSGFVWGGDLGYQFTRYLSLELGAYKLAKFEVKTPGSGLFSISSWLGYVAAKLSVPITKQISLFGKAGLAVTSIKKQRALGITKAVIKDRFVSPILALGGQWDFVSNWSVNAQMIYIPVRMEGSSLDSAIENTKNHPNEYLFLVGVSYKFAF